MIEGVKVDQPLGAPVPFNAQRAGEEIEVDMLGLVVVGRGEIAQMEMPGKEVRPGVWVGLNTSVDWDSVQIEGPVYIGSNTRIATKWVADRCRAPLEDVLRNAQAIFEACIAYARAQEATLKPPAAA